MSTSVEELVARASALSPADRERLAELLLASLPDDDEAEVEAEWEQEIKRRVEQVHAGSAHLMSSEDVHAEARKIYQR